MRKILRAYRRLPRAIVMLIAAQFMTTLVTSCLFLILNIFLAKEGYSDDRIADFISYEFMAVMILAFPLGLLIKGQRLMPLFYFASLAVPTLAFLTVQAAAEHADTLLYFCFILMGASFATLQVSMLPFILRNVPKELHSEAISLSFSTWGISTFLGGVLIFGLKKLAPEVFDEKTLLQVIACLGYLGPLLLLRARVSETVPELKGSRFDLRKHDWGLMVKALVPTIVLAIGAGLTIPFMNLYFHHIFGFDSDDYALMGACTTVLVAFGMLVIPFVRKRFGYGVAITGTQSVAVIFLVLLAGTEFYSHWPCAVYVAVACYMIRQPLMNIAAPVTSEMTMYYVGKRNQELLSAMHSSIWSGAWFISSKLFGLLRAQEMRYGKIFLITAGFYVVAVAWYCLLIRAYRRRKGREEATETGTVNTSIIRKA